MRAHGEFPRGIDVSFIKSPGFEKWAIGRRISVLDRSTRRIDLNPIYDELILKSGHLALNIRISEIGAKIARAINKGDHDHMPIRLTIMKAVKKAKRPGCHIARNATHRGSPLDLWRMDADRHPRIDTGIQDRHGISNSDFSKDFFNAINLPATAS